MVNIKKSRTIKGDPEAIWEFINQVERFPEWMPDVIEAKVIANSQNKKSEIGRQQVLKTEMSVGTAESVQRVIAWEPPHRITWEHVKDVVDGKEFKHAKEIRTTLSVTNQNGKVTFRMVGSWVPVGISGKLMTRMMKRTVSKNFEQALKNLENLVAEERKSAHRNSD